MATRAVEPNEQSSGEATADADIRTERVIDLDNAQVLDVETVDDLAVIRRLEVPTTDPGPAASPRRVYAYVPRRARPPWAKPDVLVLGDDLPNYLRAERSFHALTESGLRDLIEAPAREGRRNSPIVALQKASPNGLSHLVERLEQRGIPVTPLRDIVEDRCRLALLDDPENSIAPIPRWRRAAIRALDLLIGAVGIAAFLVLLPFVAAAVWLEDRGPVFYAQERLGRKGKPFMLFKFRSMRTDAENTGPMWATLRDERVTRVGAILRKSKLDELPQFINVLAGRMSIVGPRPERTVFVETLRRLIPYYDLRQRVRPGLTGWGTVKVGYGNSVEAKYLTHQYDLYHMKRRTIAFDLEIMIRSVFAIIARNERQDRFML